MKNLFTKGSVTAFFAKVQETTSMVTLDSGLLTLSALVKNTGFRMVSAVFTTQVKYLSRVRQLYRFSGYLYTLKRRHGSTYVVSYLKVGLLAIQKAIAGTPVASLRELDPKYALPRLSSCGLPAYIPVRDRRLIIANESASVSRWWLTLFALYRVIKVPGVLKLQTITAPLTVSQDAVDKVAVLVAELVKPTMFKTSIVLNQPTFRFLESASSTFKVSWHGFIHDMYYLHIFGLTPAVTSYCLTLGYWDILDRYHRSVAIFSEAIRDPAYHSPLLGTGLAGAIGIGIPPFVGKLSIKEESAGKRRVFAMLDSFTQTLLGNLHDMLSEFLRSLPNDGTFDQYASVRRCQTKATIAGLSYGYDLTAATDRVPVALQIAVLNAILPGLGTSWGALFNRDFGLTETSVIKTGRRTFKKVKTDHIVRYAVGQPMGALSSFNMLAVVHHLIAQLAAREAYTAAGIAIKDNPNWVIVQGPVRGTEFYWNIETEILGDDFQCFNAQIAAKYLELMERIGCGINLSKSVQAVNPTFEFAKVTGHKGRDISALSWKALLSSPTLMGTVNFVYSLLNRDIVPRGRFLPYITKVTAANPFSIGDGLPTVLIALATMLSNSGKIPLMSLLGAIASVSHRGLALYKTLLAGTNIPALKIGVPTALGNPNQVTQLRLKTDARWEEDQHWVSLTLRKVIDHALGMNYIPGDNLRVLRPITDAKALVQDFFGSPGMFIHPEVGGIGLGKTPSAAILNNAHYPCFERRWIQEEYLYLLRLIMSKMTQLRADAQAKYARADNVVALLEVLDIIDRYLELCELNKRAIARMTPQDKVINFKDSPLKLIRRLLRVDNPESLVIKQRQRMGMPNVLFY